MARLQYLTTEGLQDRERILRSHRRLRDLRVSLSFPLSLSLFLSHTHTHTDSFIHACAQEGRPYSYQLLHTAVRLWRSCLSKWPQQWLGCVAVLTHDYALLCLSCQRGTHSQPPFLSEGRREEEEVLGGLVGSFFFSIKMVAGSDMHLTTESAPRAWIKKDVLVLGNLRMTSTPARLSCISRCRSSAGKA